MNALTVILIVIAAFFFFAGTIGLLRFPDFFTRLHAMTKADNVGLGFLVLGLALQTQSWTALGQLFIVWFLILLSSASGSHLFARSGLRRGMKPWKAR
ncbi:MAG: monovalent cation/H(+) antiporter subunit G [Pseudohongiellaceae bacterium]